MNWVAISEKVPENNQDIVFCVGDHVCTGYYAGQGIFYAHRSRFKGNREHTIDEVTYWMPLPRPPDAQFEKDYHFGDLIPVPEKGRVFAYEDERIHPGAYFSASPPSRIKSEEQRRESEKYYSYELTITKHTDHALYIVLKKHRRDVPEQRGQDGCAVLCDVYSTVLSFAEFVNRLLGPRSFRSTDDEYFPESVREALKKAFGDK